VDRPDRGQSRGRAAWIIEKILRLRLTVWQNNDLSSDGAQYHALLRDIPFANPVSRQAASGC